MDVVTPPAETIGARRHALPVGGVLLPALLTLAFTAVVSAVATRHEPWFDEAQAWLLGSDCGLWELLASRVRYEGSPGLWHTLLWALSHAGLPFAKIGMASVVLASAAVWILLRHAPFPYWLRIAVAASYFVAYQYAVVARSYALALVLMLVVAACYAERLRRPMFYCVILGLLANTSAHTFIFAAILFVDWALASWRTGLTGERRTHAAAALFVVCAGAAVLQTWPPSDVSFQTGVDSSRYVELMTAAFVDRIDLFATTAPSNLSIKGGAVLSILLLVPWIRLLRHAGHLPLLGAMVTAMLVFSVLSYANLWHGGLLYLLWLFGLWISWPTLTGLQPPARKILVASVAAIVLVNDVYTFTAIRRDINEPYSAGPAAARLLAPRAGQDIAAAGFKAFAVQPWFGRNIFANYLDGTLQPAFLHWRSGQERLARPRLDNWQTMAASGRFDTLVLSSFGMPPATIGKYVDQTVAAGYCVPQIVPGGLIWKSYVLERDDLYVFYRCSPDRSPAMRLHPDQTR